MKKFYVACGVIREMVLACTPQQAAIKALQRLDGPNLLGGIFTVSERGFDFESHSATEDFVITTEVVIGLLVLAQEQAEGLGDFDNF